MTVRQNFKRELDEFRELDELLLVRSTSSSDERK
jgi:hypothetical protein